MLKIRTPLETVFALSGNKTVNVEFDQVNRYWILAKEEGIKRSFYFGIPVIHESVNRVVNLQFVHDRGVTFFSGSNSDIHIDSSVKMKNSYGYCEIIPDGMLYKRMPDSVFFKSRNCQSEILPTLNGIAIRLMYETAEELSIRLKLHQSLHSIRSNNKCVAFMREEFTPFVTVSCIGTLSVNGDVISSCEILNKKINDREYVLTFVPHSNVCKSLLFEVNMQETKLFQDTTVESKNPTMNNAFGSTAFIGNTKAFGEQWLYSRLMISNIDALSDKKIIQSILHIPVLNENTTALTLNSVESRFCSFGSNWENKIPLLKTLAESYVSNGYHHFDVTHLFGRMESKTENYVIKAKGLYKKPIIISTGDSSLLPQILEVQYL